LKATALATSSLVLTIIGYAVLFLAGIMIKGGMVDA